MTTPMVPRHMSMVCRNENIVTGSRASHISTSCGGQKEGRERGRKGMVLDEAGLWVGRWRAFYLGRAVDDAARGVRVEEAGGGRRERKAGESISHLSVFTVFTLFPSLFLSLSLST